MEFADIMLSEIHQNPQFLNKIVWTDQACFKLSGHVNRHNCVYWYDTNPHLTEKTEMNQPGVTVWADLLCSGVLGPVIFERTLNGDMYLEILRKVLPTMQAMPNLSDVIFQQDGVPPHYATHVRDFLNATFQERWIGRRGSIEWPPRSPDLTPMDFFFWGVVKEKVFQRKPRTLPDLRGFITEAWLKINIDQDLCISVSQCG